MGNTLVIHTQLFNVSDGAEFDIHYAQKKIGTWRETGGKTLADVVIKNLTLRVFIRYSYVSV